jgi:hypothetical protein
MSRIQIADLNSSEFGFMYDVNDAEMLAIIGGGFFKKTFKKLKKWIKKNVKSVKISINGSYQY